MTVDRWSWLLDLIVGILSLELIVGQERPVGIPVSIP
jgi:hypothetical protein